MIIYIHRPKWSWNAPCTGERTHAHANYQRSPTHPVSRVHVVSHTDCYHIIDAITPTVAAGQFVVDLREDRCRVRSSLCHLHGDISSAATAQQQPPSCNRDDGGRPQKSKNYVTIQISIHLPVTIKQNCILRRRAKLIATCHSPRNMEMQKKKKNCT